MKTIVLLFCMFFFNYVLSQRKYKVGDTISFKAPVKLDQKINQSFTVDNNDNYKLNILEPNFKYIIESKNTKNVTISPLNFKMFRIGRIERRKRRFQFHKTFEIDKTIRSKLYNNQLFEIDITAFESIAIKNNTQIKDRFSIGIISLPFKFRPQDYTSFDTEFNLNSTLNYRITTFYTTEFYLQLGAGIGSVGLDSSNTNNVLTKPQDVAVLTGLSGLMLQYKKVQAGFYIGVDYINNQREYQWQSNGNIWLGFGVGYELFKIELGSNKNEKQNR